ncbi:hypothetical protein VOLCADRAFT_105417 [Volvox carteri f. nagariensis]|uniref:Lipoxygenase n=1 Tax=Volvox carteri f. nagariensis TaxID=3068 RepID=D8U0N8_VOLCA|nr:uncharacterized protein VOLCADRAFT_105417 [Volvox carteri f. nagariensis]EFJ46751.1 hypothetical protein VOLCADRAFT_105417 [Volvox carteri f. nagariensis]|eukprot:XP_002952280.1 hypothetical protein VOLCADRAFT_105417 [Volvox carteri f. nagariensis]
MDLRSLRAGDSVSKRKTQSAASSSSGSLMRLRKNNTPTPLLTTPHGTPYQLSSQNHVTAESAKLNERTRNMRVYAAKAQGASSADSVEWKWHIHSTLPLLGDSGARLKLIVIDANSGIKSPEFDVDDWAWSLPRDDGSNGWKREGAILLPKNIKSPGAVLIRKEPVENGDSARDYITSFELICATSKHTFPVSSWICSDHGERVFFSGTAYLLKDTPAGMKSERDIDLEALRGTYGSRDDKRKETDRIYWYQTYNDLSTGALIRPNLGHTKDLPYPRRIATNRGNVEDREVPPPPGEEIWLPLDDRFGNEKAQEFNAGSQLGVATAAFTVIAEAADVKDRAPITLLPSLTIGIIRTIIAKILRLFSPPLDYFEDFEDVIAMYKKASSSFEALLPTKLYPEVTANPGATRKVRKASSFRSADGTWDFELKKKDAVQLDNLTTEERVPIQVGPLYGSATGTPAGRSAFTEDSKPGASGKKERVGSKLWDFLTGNTPSVNNLFNFNIPRVLDSRPNAWHSDEEFGRQAVAGYNPCVIKALTELPETFGSAIREEHVIGDLQGDTMKDLVSEAKAGGKPRLYYIDYWDLSAIWALADKDPAKIDVKPTGWLGKLLQFFLGRTDEGQAVQHAGRAILYLKKDAEGNDVGLIPVAIELAHKEQPGPAPSFGHVYSRSQLSADPSTEAVWRLAKMIFKSLDSSFHQLISHWLRTHCVLEPFYIALRRQISAMHPVYKLMLPHFRYTVNINRNARASLINAGGVIEKTFSAGPYAMRLSSIVYGKDWNFATEALPEDLKTRGMVDANGKPWLDYPYATDGLDVWNALTSYFDKYLRLYYKSDEDVENDAELKEWWSEVKTVGHGDLMEFGLRPGGEEQLWGFEGNITSVQQLVRVLATIAWLGSGHHAAVNFGQYDYTSFVLNAPSLVRKPMPAPGDKSWEKLTRAPVGEKQEAIIMTYLSDPFTAATVAATVKLLSTHARDEQTLDEMNPHLVDPDACVANQDFIEDMKRLEQTIEMRNADSKNWARFRLALGDTARPLPYTLLLPGSPAGVTMRGVPYSVSI